ncbi:hypothetical protein Goari_010137 [Gossypium aridum]|uniref:Uncharacterized protein n=1 Tax=Gossypium aridum TaxID=34290 RepID=A0A7J8XZ27_GOSAI|nr:hypothetical protein [Gossypium aridum]
MGVWLGHVIQVRELHGHGHELGHGRVKQMSSQNFFHSYCFQFVSQSSNNTSHKMAKDGLSCDEDKFWVEEALTVVFAANAEDRRLLGPP